MKMTFEDIEEYRKNAIERLKREDQHATAKAVDIAFSALICVDQFKWERDVVLEQLKDLGINLGEEIDGKYLTKEEYEELLEYKYMYEDLCN